MSSKSTGVYTKLSVPNEFISMEYAITACKYDAPTFNKEDPKSYLDGNYMGYYLVMNTWMALCSDQVANKSVIQSLCNRIKREIGIRKSCGLSKLIAEADATASAILEGDELPSRVFAEFVTNAVASLCDDYSGQPSEVLEQTAMRKILQCLRYPKRFSPVEAPLLIDKAMEKFCIREKVNARLNVRNAKVYNPILDRAKEIVAEIFGNSTPVMDVGAFSAGSSNYLNASRPLSYVGSAIKTATYTGKTRADKWLAAIGDTTIVPWEYSCTIPGEPGEQVSWIRAVPKSIKTGRIIGMETPTAGWHAFSLREWMWKKLKRSKWGALINLKDQSQNRHLAAKGSLEGELATIDLSSASDSISYALGCDLFSQCPQLWSQLTSCRAKWMVGTPLTYRYKRKAVSDSLWETRHFPTRDGLDKAVYPVYTGPTLFRYSGGAPAVTLPEQNKGDSKFYVSYEGKVPTQMLFTSGTQLTFICESIVFMSLVVAACEYAALFTGRRVRSWKDQISIYGDDIICPTWAAETVMDVLRNFGFEVNTSKSFYNSEPMYGKHYFRESCGGDYLNGIDISSVYFPRQELSLAVQDLNETLAALVDLNHRLFTLSPTAANVVSDFVLAIKPNMTESTPDQGLQDLWSTFAMPTQAMAPIKPGCMTSQMREIHLQPSTGWKVHPSLRYIVEKRELGAQLYQQLEEIRYMTFLKEGPFYTNALDELLGVSTPRPSVRELCAQPCVKWLRVYE